MNMKEIADRESLLRSHYINFLQLMEQLSDEQLHQPMESGKWSPAQTLGHVNKSTLLSVSYLLKQLNGQKELERHKLSNKIKQYLLLRALRSDKKYKAPKAVAEIPAAISMEQLRDEVATINEQLDQVKELWSEALLGRNVYRHPIAGPLNLAGFYDFLLEHLRHHRRQVEQFVAATV
jgi:uncharacterized damage-inducible protein DinB